MALSDAERFQATRTDRSPAPASGRSLWSDATSPPTLRRDDAGESQRKPPAPSGGASPISRPAPERPAKPKPKGPAERNFVRKFNLRVAPSDEDQPSLRADARPSPATATDTAAVPRGGEEQSGFTAGAFKLKPAIEASVGFENNSIRGPSNARDSPILAFAPEMEVRSQFERHQLDADLRGRFTDFTAQQSASFAAADLKLRGRFDVDDKTSLSAEARYNVDRGDPASISEIVRTARLPTVSTTGGTLGVTRKFGDLEVSFKPSINRTTFDSTQLRNGVVAPNLDRDFTQFGAQARLAYALYPELSPFVRVDVDRRVHDLPLDFFGFQRDSTGVAAALGASFLVPGKLAGDLAIGYLTRNFADPRLTNVGAVTVDASLAYLWTADTTFLLAAKSEADEAIVPGNSAILRRDALFEIDHQITQPLGLSLKAGYGKDQFVGTPRDDNRVLFGAGLAYKFSKFLQFKLDVREDLLRSNRPINNMNASTVTVGVRAQY